MTDRHLEDPRLESSGKPAGPFKVFFQYTGALDARALQGALIAESSRGPTEVEKDHYGQGWIFYDFDDDTFASDREATIEWLAGMPGMSAIRCEAS